MVPPVCQSATTCADCLKLSLSGCVWAKVWGQFKQLNGSSSEMCAFPEDITFNTTYENVTIYDKKCPCDLFNTGFDSGVLPTQFTVIQNGTNSTITGTEYYSANYSFYLDELPTLSYSVLTLTLVLPCTTSHIQLSFESLVELESTYTDGAVNDTVTCYDGGFLSAEVNTGAGGSFVPVNLSISVPYTSNISGSFNSYFAGSFAWCRSTAEAEWTLVSVDLTPYACQTIEISWTVANDDSEKDVGWFIDDVDVQYDCPDPVTCASYTNCTMCHCAGCVWIQDWDEFTGSCRAPKPTKHRRTKSQTKTKSDEDEDSEDKKRRPPRQSTKTKDDDDVKFDGDDDDDDETKKKSAKKCPCTKNITDFESGIVNGTTLTTDDTGSGLQSHIYFDTEYLFFHGRLDSNTTTVYSIDHLKLPKSDHIQLCFLSYMFIPLNVGTGKCDVGTFVSVNGHVHTASVAYDSTIATGQSNKFEGTTAWCHNTHTTQNICVDLTKYSKKTIAFSFSLGNPLILDTNLPYYGWAIDNITLTWDCNKRHRGDDDDDDYWWIWLIGAGVVVIILAVGAYMMWGRRSNRRQYQGYQVSNQHYY